MLLWAFIASCLCLGSLAISIADSLDPLAYFEHGGPSPRLVSFAGSLLPELIVGVTTVDARAVVGSERPILRREPCLPE